ncbi:MAG: DarT ssDNA thymidine ADP-ribosyltransferase family protein [Desulfomonilaceae bacterium]
MRSGRDHYRLRSFLFCASFPWELIHELVVMTERAKNAAEKILIESGTKIDVKIRPQWYF